METWAWLVAYVVGFGFVQWLLYRYFQREGPSPDATPTGGDGSAGHGLEPSRSGDANAGVHCRHCGAFNENGTPYFYCRECVEPMQ